MILLLLPQSYIFLLDSCGKRVEKKRHAICLLTAKYVCRFFLLRFTKSYCYALVLSVVFVFLAKWLFSLRTLAFYFLNNCLPFIESVNR